MASSSYNASNNIVTPTTKNGETYIPRYQKETSFQFKPSGEVTATKGGVTQVIIKPKMTGGTTAPPERPAVTGYNPETENSIIDTRATVEARTKEDILRARQSQIERDIASGRITSATIPTVSGGVMTITKEGVKTKERGDIYVKRYGFPPSKEELAGKTTVTGKEMIFTKSFMESPAVEYIASTEQKTYGYHFEPTTDVTKDFGVIEYQFQKIDKKQVGTGMFGGVSISPADTSLKGKAQMLYMTSRERLFQEIRTREQSFIVKGIKKEIFEDKTLRDIYQDFTSAPLTPLIEAKQDIIKDFERLQEIQSKRLPEEYSFGLNIKYTGQKIKRSIKDIKSGIFGGVSYYKADTSLKGKTEMFFMTSRERAELFFSSRYPKGDLKIKSGKDQEFFNIGENLKLFTKAYFPTTKTELATLYLLGKAYQKFPISTSLVTGGISAYQFQKPTTREERITAGLTFGISTIGLYQSAKPKVMDIYMTKKYGLKPFRLAEYETKPFKRKGEYYFFKRYEGIKLKEPKSFIYYLEGYKKGQFLEKQQYKAIPEVKAYYEGKKEVTAYFYDIEKDKFIYETRKTTPFPYGSKTEQLKYFKIGQKIFSSPRRKEIPIEIEGYSFGIHATPKYFELSQQKEPLYQIFYSGKGGSLGFLYLTGESPYSFGLFKRASSQQPVLIESYFKDVRVEPRSKEIKIPNPFGTKGGKPIKQYTFDKYGIEIPAGELYIPLQKREVEGVIRGRGIKLRQSYYFKYGGRRIMIEERLMGKNLEAESKKLGVKYLSEKELRKTSYIPSKSDRSFIQTYIYSSISRQTSSRVSKTSGVSSRVSGVSRISGVSGVSSKVSYASYPSYPSYPSRVSYDYYGSSTGSGISKRPPIRKKGFALIDISLEGKKKEKEKPFKYKEDALVYYADFTSKVLGRKAMISRPSALKRTKYYSGIEPRPIPQ